MEGVGGMDTRKSKIQTVYNGLIKLSFGPHYLCPIQYVQVRFDLDSTLDIKSICGQLFPSNRVEASIIRNNAEERFNVSIEEIPFGEFRLKYYREQRAIAEGDPVNGWRNFSLGPITYDIVIISSNKPDMTVIPDEV